MKIFYAVWPNYKHISKETVDMCGVLHDIRVDMCGVLHDIREELLSQILS